MKIPGFGRPAVGGALAAAALAAMLNGCGGRHVAGTTGTTAHSVEKCPLTNANPPEGRVPARPALAVKVDNLAVARPPYGLSAADVVYEEPVEGGITRFVVIYQCRDAARIEPIRSARIIDPAIVSQFGAHPLFGHAGGIQAALAAIAGSPLIDVGIYRAPGAYRRDPARSAPHNLTTSTGALYAAGNAQQASTQPPPPVFSYGPPSSAVNPATSVHIAYPSSGVIWSWQAGLHQWVRSYPPGGPAELGEGGQITAANIIIMKVVLYPSPYVEDPTGAHENLLVLTGSGPAQVFRDGTSLSGTWNRSALTQRTQYHDIAGHTMTLSPGSTWVELVPTTVTVTVTP